VVGFAAQTTNETSESPARNMTLLSVSVIQISVSSSGSWQLHGRLATRDILQTRVEKVYYKIMLKTGICQACVNLFQPTVVASEPPNRILHPISSAQRQRARVHGQTELGTQSLQGV
jgi:hypothetical protein